MCEQPQQGPRDIWTQIYPIEHTGDPPSRDCALVAAPERRPALLDRGTGSLAGGGRRSSYPACLPYNQAKAREVVSG